MYGIPPCTHADTKSDTVFCTHPQNNRACIDRAGLKVGAAHWPSSNLWKRRRRASSVFGVPWAILASPLLALAHDLFQYVYERFTYGQLSSSSISVTFTIMGRSNWTIYLAYVLPNMTVAWSLCGT